MPKPKTKKSVADTAGTSAKGGTVELPKELIDQLLAAAGGGAGLTWSCPCFVESSSL